MSDHSNIDELPDSQRSATHKKTPAGTLLKEIKTYKTKYEEVDVIDGHSKCYSVSCRDGGRSDCYSPLCMLKDKSKQKLLNSVNNYKIVTSKRAPYDEVGAHSPIRLNDKTVKVEMTSESVTTTTTSVVTSVNGTITSSNSSSSVEVSRTKNETVDDGENKSTNSSEVNIKLEGELEENSNQSSKALESKFRLKTEKTHCTKGKVYLKKIVTSETKRSKKTQIKVPPISHFAIAKRRRKVVRPQGKTSLLILPKWEQKLIARRAGKYTVYGFNHNAKPNNSVWPYPCARPSFKLCWLYRTINMMTQSAVALQLRILWGCLRWDDMSEKSPSDGRKQVTTDMEIVQTEILKRKSSGRFFEKTEYLRRKVTIPFDVPKPVRGKFFFSIITFFELYICIYMRIICE